MSIEQKLNFGRSMNRFAEKKVEDALQKAGKILPASVVKQDGQMITVAFELRDTPFVLPQVTVPLFGPQYIRYPMQPGDKGIVIPADTYLGGVSGLGGGIADLTPPDNLSSLLFLPISNTEWEAVDGQVVTIYGPEGVTIRDAASNSTFLLTPDSVTIATQEQFQVTVGSTVFLLTKGKWSLSGQAGKIQDSAASTSPEIMQRGWAALVEWLNSHLHSDDGAGVPVSPFSGDITE